MKVTFMKLTSNDGWSMLKCFYDEPEGYGEFFLKINQEKGLIEFEPKDGYYEQVLTDAFRAAMRLV